MARKSRRTITIEKPAEEVIQGLVSEVRIKTAGYVRLSGDSQETDSIETQQLMIRQYAKEHGEFDIVDMYVDDGFSGTDFNRPGFMKLMEDVRHGVIQCIIVKDLSRFGRNYIETGYYIETILPQLNVRLIAINDLFDSSRPEDLQGMRLPIKNMVNAMYAKDLSKKFSDSYDLHFQTGTYKLRESTYGYRLDRNANMLLVDKPTAGIVKLIFRWAKEGKTADEIAKLLTFAGAERPGEAKKRLEGKREKAKYNDWEGAMVRRILLIPTYTGDMVYGRSRRRKYEQSHTRRTEKELWITNPGTHEALVSHEDYEKVASVLALRASKYHLQSMEIIESKKRLNNPFPRKVICKECGIVMNYRRETHFNSKQMGYAYAQYVCTHERKVGCGKKIDEDYLRALVLDQIKSFIKLVCDNKQMAKDLMQGIKKAGKLASLDKKAAYAKRKIADLERTLEKLYVDYSEGTIEEEEYKSFQYYYLQEKEFLLSKLKDYEDEESRCRNQIRAYLDLENRMEQFLNVSEYSQNMINEFVEQIGLGANNSVEIRLKCEDVFANYMKILEENSDD